MLGNFSRKTFVKVSDNPSIKVQASALTAIYITNKLAFCKEKSNF